MFPGAAVAGLWDGGAGSKSHPGVGSRLCSVGENSSGSSVSCSLFYMYFLLEQDFLTPSVSKEARLGPLWIQCDETLQLH